MTYLFEPWRVGLVVSEVESIGMCSICQQHVRDAKASHLALHHKQVHRSILMYLYHGLVMGGKVGFSGCDT